MTKTRSLTTDLFRILLSAASAFLLVALAAGPAAAWQGDGWGDDPWDDEQHYHDDGTVCEHEPGYHDSQYRDQRDHHRYDRHDRGQGRGDRRDELRRGEGVVIFSEDGFEGRATLFSGDVHDLNGTYVGNDTASSVLVAPGCKVALYEHQDYRGRSVELSYDVADLGDTLLRDDRLSSLRLDCRGGWNDGWGHDGGGSDQTDPRRQIVLYEHQDFLGKSREVSGDVTDLNRIYMNDLVSSIRVPRGCDVLLFEHPDFRGKSYRITGDISDLNRVYMNDLVTSLRVDCRGGGTGTGGWGGGGGVDGRPDTRGAVVLYEHPDFRGKSRVITGDVTDLNHLNMNDLVSSIQVARGCEVFLYEHQNFRGKSYQVTGDITDLNRVSMNDLVTSLRVECRRR